MHKLVARFPREVTIKSLAEDIITGKQVLWLILEGDEFRSFVLTEIKHNPATDIKTSFVTSLAGEDGIDAVPLDTMADWVEPMRRFFEAPDLTAIDWLAVLTHWSFFVAPHALGVAAAAGDRSRARQWNPDHRQRRHRREHARQVGRSPGAGDDDPQPP